MTGLVKKPAQFVVVWTACRFGELHLAFLAHEAVYIERLARGHLGVDQVEVDRVGVPNEVEDAPDLDGPVVYREHKHQMKRKRDVKPEQP